MAAPVQLSLIGKNKIILPYLTNVAQLRARVITARGNQSQANLNALQYILSPNPGTLVDRDLSKLVIAQGNVVKGRLNWKGLYPQSLALYANSTATTPIYTFRGPWTYPSNVPYDIRNITAVMIAEAIRFNLADLQARSWQAQNPTTFDFATGQDFFKRITTPSSMEIYKNWSAYSQGTKPLPTSPPGLAILVPWIS